MFVEHSQMTRCRLHFHCCDMTCENKWCASAVLVRGWWNLVDWHWHTHFNTRPHQRVRHTLKAAKRYADKQAGCLGIQERRGWKEAVLYLQLWRFWTPAWECISAFFQSPFSPPSFSTLEVRGDFLSTYNIFLGHGRACYFFIRWRRHNIQWIMLLVNRITVNQVVITVSPNNCSRTCFFFLSAPQRTSTRVFKGMVAVIMWQCPAVPLTHLRTRASWWSHDHPLWGGSLSWACETWSRPGASWSKRYGKKKRK